MISTGSRSITPNDLFTRRRCLTICAGLALGTAIKSAGAIEPFDRKRPSHFKLSLAAYSYRDYLKGENTPAMDLFGFLELAADLGLDAVEPTSYYFPKDVTDDYCHRLKQRAFVLGLDISGT